MDNSELLNEISYWRAQMSIPPTELNGASRQNINRFLENRSNEIVEIAFLKIYVKFEKFVANLFEHFCLGEVSLNHNYCPNRSLVFTTQTQLHKVLSKKGDVILSIDDITSYSDHIFNTLNPFNILTLSPNYELIQEMKIIRNYIAHESQAAKTKYIKHFFGGNINNFQEPKVILKRTMRVQNLNKSKFSNYIETLENLSNYLINPLPSPSSSATATTTNTTTGAIISSP